VRVVASRDRSLPPSRPDAGERNRRTVRVLLAIVLMLVAATILAGIRW
jgi:hypothetical protein